MSLGVLPSFPSSAQLLLCSPVLAVVKLVVLKNSFELGSFLILTLACEQDAGCYRVEAIPGPCRCTTFHWALPVLSQTGWETSVFQWNSAQKLNTSFKTDTVWRYLS